MISQQTIGVTAALASAASWAMGSILFQRLGEKVSPLAMTLAKGAVSVVYLGLALILTQIDRVDWQSLLILALSGLIGIALGDTFFFEALQDLGASVLVVLLMLGQVLTALFAVVFLKETPTQLVWMGIGLVVLGVGIVLSAKIWGESQQSKLKGIIFGLLSVLCMSGSIVIAKIGLASVSALQATFIRMLAGTLGIFCFGVSTQRLSNWTLPFYNQKLLGNFLLSVAVVTFGGFWLSLLAIKYVDVSVANTLSSTEPLFVLPLAAVFLHEKITHQALLGTGIAVLGIVLLCQS